MIYGAYLRATYMIYKNKKSQSHIKYSVSHRMSNSETLASSSISKPIKSIFGLKWDELEDTSNIKLELASIAWTPSNT